MKFLREILKNSDGYDGTALDKLKELQSKETLGMDKIINKGCP